MRWGLLCLLVLSAAYGLTDLGIDENIARIADFDNDGQNEVLAFPDRIDTDEAGIKYYDQNDGSFFLYQTIAGELFERCALDYGDPDRDGQLDIVWQCFEANSTSIQTGYASWDGNVWINTSNFTSISSFESRFSTLTYGDLLFFDFTGDGQEEILSCFANSSEELSIYLYDNGAFVPTASGIPADDFNQSGSITSCYLAPLDIDADGDLDIITYTYDANNFSLYNNTWCDTSSCSGSGFEKISSGKYYNSSVFNESKIKNLRAFDDGDGFPELYYIIDTNASTGGTRNISFGYFTHQARGLSAQTFSVPTLSSSYYFDDARYVDASWINETNTSYLDINITGLYGISPLFFHLNITNSNNGTIISGEQAITNYDYKAGYGNLLLRQNLSLNLTPQCMQSSAVGISAGFLQSASNVVETNVTLNTSTIELCDGLDNDCDGVADEDFNFTWPDGVITEIKLDEDEDGSFLARRVVSRTNGSDTWALTFNCTYVKLNTGSTKTDALFYDGDDSDASITCRQNSVTCGFAGDTDESDTGGSNGGSGGFSGFPSTPGVSAGTNTVSDITGVGGGQEPQADPDGGSNGVDTDLADQPQPEQSPPEKAGIKYDEPEVLITDLSTKNYRHKREVTVIGDQTRVTERVVNVNFFPLQDVSVTLNIPKEIHDDALTIETDYPVIIIERNPIIKFELGDIAPYESKEISYVIPRPIEDYNVSLLVETLTLSEEEQEAQIQEIEEQLNKTAEVVDIIKTVESDNESTTFTIDVEFDDDQTILYNVSIFEEIPKCLVEIINDEIAEANRDFEIINEDPLIVWHFEELLNGEQIQLRIAAIADEDCENAGNTIALARDIIAVSFANEEDISIVPPLILIGILFVILVIMANFTREKYHVDPDVQVLIHKAKLLLRKKHPLDEVKQKLLEQDHHESHVEKAIDAVTHPIRQFFVASAIGLETLILFTLIILNVFDFFKAFWVVEKLTFIDLGPGDIDFIKKMISWILLALVFYHVGITKVLFGRDHRWVDVTLLFAFFLLTFKNFVGFAKQTFIETIFARDLYVIIINNNDVITTWTFLVGILGILIATLYVCFKRHVFPDSLYGALFNKSNGHENWLLLFIHVIFVQVLFFVLVFNLMFEWLAIAVDAPILMVVIVVTLMSLVSLKLHKHLRGNIIEEITETPDHFYEKLIDLFHHPKYLPLGIAGMFILHLVTEIGVYVIPYVLGVLDPVYVTIDRDHTPIFSVLGTASRFVLDAGGFAPLVQLQYFAGYALNILGLLTATLLPIWLWLYMYKHKKKPLFKTTVFKSFSGHEGIYKWAARLLVVLFPVGVIMFLSKPAFLLKAITSRLLAGVDILTQSIDILGLYFILLASLLTLIVVIVLERRHLILITSLVLLVSMIFLLFYNLLYINSLIVYVFGLFELFDTWDSYWLIIRNITASFTVIFTLLSLGALYIIGFGLVVFMYLPTRLKKKVYWLLPHHIAKAQEHHHVHFHHIHDQHIHGHKVDVVKQHIEEQLKEGHELFWIVEHLHEKHWPWDVIEQAVVELDDTKRFAKELKHIDHHHHNREAIDDLKKWIVKEYKKAELDNIIEKAKEEGWTEDDIGLALKHITLKKRDKHLADYLENVSEST